MSQRRPPFPHGYPWPVRLLVAAVFALLAVLLFVLL
jgi:hypothetical protein